MIKHESEKKRLSRLRVKSPWLTQPLSLHDHRALFCTFAAGRLYEAEGKFPMAYVTIVLA